MRKRVVFAGLGAVTPPGSDLPALWAGLVVAQFGAGPSILYDPSCAAVRIAAQARALSKSFGIDGHNATLLFAHWGR
jgi:3-oxoacyl-(acyl-carrier-protein) synthase